jgi:hypothetical protein
MAAEHSKYRNPTATTFAVLALGANQCEISNRFPSVRCGRSARSAYLKHCKPDRSTRTLKPKQRRYLGDRACDTFDEPRAY